MSHTEPSLIILTNEQPDTTIMDLFASIVKSYPVSQYVVQAATNAINEVAKRISPIFEYRLNLLEAEKPVVTIVAKNLPSDLFLRGIHRDMALSVPEYGTVDVLDLIAVINYTKKSEFSDLLIHEQLS